MQWQRIIRSTLPRALSLAAFSLVGMVCLPSSAHASPHVVPPSRLLDTRDATGGHKGRLGAGETFQLAVTGVADVPGNATAVALNVTAVNPVGDGFLSAWPCGGPEPTTSNLNFVGGQIVANSVMVGVGTNGRVCLKSSVATDVLADVSAWFDGTSPFAPLAPDRLVDTRSGVGFAARKLNAGEVLTIPIRGQRGVGGDAGAAVVNLTATAPDGEGFLTAYPCDQAVPTSSNLNFDGGRTVPNAVVATLAGNGSMCVTTSVATHVLVDLMGWMHGGESTPVKPTRLLDTRSGIGAPRGFMVAPMSTAVVSVAGQSGVPGGTGLAILNVTATGATGDGFATAFPCDRPLPNTSTLNIVRGRNVANLAVVPVANDGTVCISAQIYGTGAVHLVADVMGWLPGPALAAIAPTRFATLPLGAPLPSSDQCAARVRRAPENKRMNTAKNSVRGSNRNLGGPAPFARVDGNFSGTTDELLQWVSCKWGLDEDIVRGIVAKESWWRDDTLGDLTGESSVCAYGHSIGSDGQAGVCPQSIGLAQINYQYYRDGFPAAAESNAYHLDYALAVWRSCYEGAYTWLNNVDKGATYGAGDAWGCVGFWNAGRWHTAKGEGYVSEVQEYINQRIWEQPRFQEA